jgi:hypothetical protein
LLLDDLIEQHGPGAVITVSRVTIVNPVGIDTGETLRWVVLIDGANPDVDVRVDDEGDMRMLLLSRGNSADEVTLIRWNAKRQPEINFVDTLGGIRRRLER